MPSSAFVSAQAEEGCVGARLSANEVVRLLDRASDVVYRYRVRPERAVEYINRAVTRLTGFTQAEHYADPELMLKIVHPDDRPLLEELLTHGAGGGPLFVRLHRRNDQLVWVEQLTTSILDASGELVAVEGIAREVADPTEGRRPSVRTVGDVRIETDRGRVVVNGQPVHLTPSEFRVLTLLTDQPGVVVSREAIMEALWDSRHVGDGRTSEVHVSKLRRKIEPDVTHPQRIQTVRGRGYRFVPVHPVDPDAGRLEPEARAGAPWPSSGNPQPPGSSPPSDVRS
jgi:DNA-binding winged helix-turn-helix (wHTH) protein